MPTGLHCPLVDGTDNWQDAIVKCGRPGMASSIAEAYGVMTRVWVEEV